MKNKLLGVILTTTMGISSLNIHAQTIDTTTDVQPPAKMDVSWIGYTHLLDKLDDGVNLNINESFQKDSRIYGYFYDSNNSTIENVNIEKNKEFIYTVPTGACMDSSGLPAILPINFNLYDFISFRNEKNITDHRKYFDKIKEIEETLNRHLGNIKKIKFESWLNEQNIHNNIDLAGIFKYSTDGGQTYKSYTNRDDENLPTDCSITNFKVTNTLNVFYTYNIKVKDENINKIEETLTVKSTTKNEVGELKRLISKTELPSVNNCKIVTVEINVEGEKPQDPPVDEPKDEPKDPPKDPDPTPNPPPTIPTTPTKPGGGGWNPTTPTMPSTIPTTVVNTITNTTKPSGHSNGFVMDFKYETIDDDYEILVKNRSIIQKAPILPKMGTTLNEKSRIWAEKLKLIETRIKKEKFRLAGSTNTDLSHWLQVLDEDEKNLDQYIVIPSNGLVMPIINVDENDPAYNNFLNGITEHFYKYASNGAVELPGYKANNFGENGNKVIGGHSSWWRNDARYKTHFQKLIGMETEKEIWVYQKNENWEYTRFVYSTIDSYNTKDTDTTILDQTEDSQITLFTCTPIGGDLGRWVVKAKFLYKE